MRLLTLLLLLAAGLIALLLLARNGERAAGIGEVPGPVPTSPSAPGDAGQASQAALDARRPAAREAGPEPELELAPFVEPEEAEPTLRVLRGLLTDGEGGPPLTEMTLEVVTSLAPREVLTRVLTDADGRFVTKPLPCIELFLRHLPDLADPERALALWIRPGNFTLPPSDEGEPYEREFWAQRPADVVVVDVVRDDGSPAPGAFVQLAFTAVQPGTGGRLSTGGAAPTGPEGRAYVGLYDSAHFERGTLFARGAGGTVSEVLSLDASDYRGPHRLRLGAACTLVVRARWSEGTPAQGRALRLHGPRDYPRPGEPERFVGVTDERGECTLPGLYPSTYTVSIDNPRTQGTSADTVRLWAGRTSELEVELGAGERELAASGMVLDEEGAALAGVELVLRPDARWAESVVTDAGGRFEYWATPCELIRIALDALPHGDAFEPSARSVPFGTHGLVFERVARAKSMRFRVRATDRATGSVIEKVFLTFDRGPEREEWSNTFAPRESYVVDATADTRCKVAARGYVVQTVSLREALAEAQGTPPLLEFELDRGLAHDVRVLDAETRAPVAGAVFRAHGLVPVQSDAQGHARLEGDRWGTFVVTCEGYEPAAWDPEEAILFDQGPVFLSPRP